MLRIAMIIGSTRPPRVGEAVGRWAYGIARQRNDAEFALIDLTDFNLPRTAIERLAHAGAVPNTALAVVTELFRDWKSPLAEKAREVISWYFAEVPKLGTDIGV